MAAFGQEVDPHPVEGPLLDTCDRNGYSIMRIRPGDMVSVKEPLGFTLFGNWLGNPWYGRILGVKQRIGYVLIEPASRVDREGQYDRVPTDDDGHRLVVVEHGSWTFENDRENSPIQQRRFTVCQFLHVTVAAPYDSYIALE